MKYYVEVPDAQFLLGTNNFKQADVVCGQVPA